MKKILPILMIILGVGVGVGAGFFMKPHKEMAELEHPCGPDTSAAKDMAKAEFQDKLMDREYVKLANQFVH